MLPVVIFSLLVASVFAAPQTRINQRGPGNSRGRENTLLDRVFEVVDQGSLNAYQLSHAQVLSDIFRYGAQAQALGNAFAVIGQVATGRSGDACAAANLINAYTRRVSTGNVGGLRNALNNFVQDLIGSIDNIVSLITNPASTRFATGSRGGCAAEGRKYEFEAAWDSILGSVQPNLVSLLDESYCGAKLQYCAFSVQSNNFAAHNTASSLPITVQVFEIAGQELSSLAQSIASGQNLGQAASAAKRALVNAAARVQL